MVKYLFTRTDGLGQRILAYLEAHRISAESDYPFAFLWLNGGGMERHGVQGNMLDIFQIPIETMIFVDDQAELRDAIFLAPQWVYWKGCVPVGPLIPHLANLLLVDALQDRVMRLPKYKYTVHARQGDVAENAREYGKTKWIPKEMYVQLFKQLAKESDGYDVFLASDSPELKKIARELLPRCETDDVFFWIPVMQN